MPAPKPAPQTVEDWLTCLTLPEYLAAIPVGQIRPIFGPIIWTDGNGKQMSTEEYVYVHGFDPRLAWDAKKAYRKAHGEGVHIVEE
jgi:hypothetical protein